VDPVLRSLDHAVIAVRDLAVATERYAALLGRPPSWRGVHPGFGTANSLFRLENCYLELLAVQGSGPLGERIAGAIDAAGEGLVALAFGTDDADACAGALRARGIDASEPQEGEGGEAETGALRRWRSVGLPTAATRGLVLFAIEHRSSDAALPIRVPDAAPESAVSALDHVVVSSSDLEAARELYGRGLGLRLALERRFEARALRILFFRVGGVTVELVGALDGRGDPEAPDRFGGLAYRVADADAARGRLAEAGFDVSRVRPGAKLGTRVCTVRRETCGVPTLLIEPSLGSGSELPIPAGER
jgi:catechol 2,3-dioxygenase-like lactoylglutathione lyase family enzyme